MKYIPEIWGKENLMKTKRILALLLAMAMTFALACAFWVFFRAPTLADAWAFLVRAANMW